jgi:protein CpxP
MSEQSHPAAQSDPARGGLRRTRRWLFVTTIALAAALTGGLASRAVSQHSWHGRGWHGPSFGGLPLDPTRVEEGVDRAVRHLAIEIEANGEQEQKLRAIVKGAVKDLLPMRETALAARQRGHVLLTQPTIDRAAIEALRAEQLALADAASKRFAQALGDAAEVLTPEQRRRIDNRLMEFRQHRGFWPGWRRG